VRDLLRDWQGLVDRNRSLRDAIGKRCSLDELEDEGANAIRFFEAVDRCDVRMIERSKELRFALEPREPVGIEREVGRQDLQRDVAIELCVTRAIHLAHAAGTDGGENLVRTEASAGCKLHGWRRSGRF